METRFVASKTKVAPMVTMSIPRLELFAAVMGLRLAQSVLKVLQMAIGRAIFWSDSTNTLWWIRGNGQCLKTLRSKSCWRNSSSDRSRSMAICNDQPQSSRPVH